jgi:hypothetical protein
MNDRLFDALRRVDQKLSQLPGGDARSRELVDQARLELRQVLEEKRSSGTTREVLVSRLRAAAVQFEQEHPTLGSSRDPRRHGPVSLRVSRRVRPPRGRTPAIRSRC